MAKAKRVFRKATQKSTPRRIPAPAQDEGYIHYSVVKKDGKFLVHRLGSPDVDDGYDAAGQKLKQDSENSEYANLFRMYPSGRVCPVCEIGSKTADDNDPRLVAFNATQEEAQRLVEAAYDLEFPEIAAKVQAFISDSVSDILSLDYPRQADGVFDDKSLLNIAQQQEKEFLTKGWITPLLGWEIAPGEAFLLPVALPADGKYRYARAVSEIAQITNARAIIQIGETWGRDVETGERNGQEGLMVTRVLPDANVDSCVRGTYIRVNGQMQVVEPVSATTSKDQRLEQHLYPAWKVAGTVSVKATQTVN